LFTDVR